MGAFPFFFSSKTSSTLASFSLSNTSSSSRSSSSSDELCSESESLSMTTFGNVILLVCGDIFSNRQKGRSEDCGREESEDRKHRNTEGQIGATRRDGNGPLTWKDGRTSLLKYPSEKRHRSVKFSNVFALVWVNRQKGVTGIGIQT